MKERNENEDGLEKVERKKMHKKKDEEKKNQKMRKNVNK